MRPHVCLHCLLSALRGMPAMPCAHQRWGSDPRFCWVGRLGHATVTDKTGALLLCNCWCCSTRLHPRCVGKAGLELGRAISTSNGRFCHGLLWRLDDPSRERQHLGRQGPSRTGCLSRRNGCDKPSRVKSVGGETISGKHLLRQHHCGRQVPVNDRHVHGVRPKLLDKRRPTRDIRGLW